MSLKKNSRWVLVTKLVISNEQRVPPSNPIYTFDEIEDQLLALHRDSSTSYLHDKDNKKLQIRDISRYKDDKYLSILVSLGDKDAPDVSYEDFNSGEIQTHEKSDDEGVVVTAHILIKRKPEINGSHIMMIEKVPGIFMAKLARYFTYLMKTLNTRTFESSDNQKHHYRPLFDVLGYQSGTLREALETNILKDIEFVGQEAIKDDFDEGEVIQERVKRAKFVINKGIQTDTIDPLFARLKNQFHNGGYEKFLVRIKTTNDQIKQTELDMEHGDMLAQFFICNEFIKGFEPPLESAAVSIRKDMISKLESLVNKYI